MSHPHKKSHPRPLITFTIPSIYPDDSPKNPTLLNCKLYHPTQIPDFHTSPIDAIDAQRRRRIKCAIISHPYAPLGGSQDDAVVIAVVEKLVVEGFIVGTFNFRGASGSNSRTTLSAEGETSDYMSMIGLMVHYANELASKRYNESDGLSPRTPGALFRVDKQITVDLILGGYSYGSMIVSRLSETSDVLNLFANAQPGSSAAGVLSKAKDLAVETIALESKCLRTSGHTTPNFQGQEPGSPQIDDIGSPRTSFQEGIVMGGSEESDSSTRPRLAHKGSDNIRRSFDAASRAIKRAVSREKFSRSNTKSDNDSAVINDTRVTNVSSQSPDKGTEHGPRVATRYLLISPVLPPISDFLAFSSSNFLPNLFGRFSGLGSKSDLFSKFPTLAVFGSDDGFTSAKKLTAWAGELKKKTTTLVTETNEISGGFDSMLVEGAGHFWREEGVLDVLVEKVGRWSSEI